MLFKKRLAEARPGIRGSENQKTRAYFSLLILENKDRLMISRTK
jgi:hypothetical protein